MWFLYIRPRKKFIQIFLISFKNRNDKVHPYKSGVISARMFYRNNFLKVDGQNAKESLEKDIDQLCHFLSHSNRKEKYTHCESNIKNFILINSKKYFTSSLFR